MVRRFCFGMFLVFSLAVLCNSASAITDPNMITGIAKTNSVAEEDLLIHNGGLQVDAVSHVDRTFVITDTGALGGIDYVQTAVDDKTNASLQYDVTVDTAGKLLLLFDNRVNGDGSKDATTPPDLSGITEAAWVENDGFVQTAYQIVVNDVPMTAYVKDVTAGTYSTYSQGTSSSYVTYLIAAVPDGYNLPPVVAGVPENASIAPGETLDIDATATDLFGSNTNLTFSWVKTSGDAVTFSPNTGSEDVSVSFAAEGEYTLQLTVTDGNNTQVVKTIAVSVEIPKFELDIAQHIEVGNDNKMSSTSHNTSTPMNIRNYNGTDQWRHRVTYLKFDISSLKEEGKAFANTFINFYYRKGSSSASMYVYGLKEDLDDVDLSSGTWANMPGVQNSPVPDYTTPITIDSVDLADLSPVLLEVHGFQADETIDSYHKWCATDTAAGLDEFMNADSDGIVILMLVTFAESPDFEIWSETYLSGNIIEPDYATGPTPTINEEVGADLPQLSWNNPSGEGTITSDVYIAEGICEPNDVIGNGDGFESLVEDTTDTFVALEEGDIVGGTAYSWLVVSTDSATGTPVRGPVWTFSVVSDLAPEVNIVNDTEYIWYGNTDNAAYAEVTLVGEVSDDHDTVTPLWEDVSDNGGNVIPAGEENSSSITLQLADVGTYTIKLSATDNSEQTSYDSVTIVVAETACDAAKEVPGYEANPADLNNDCKVNFADFVKLAESWLDCNSLDCD